MNKKLIIPIFIPHLGCPHTCVFCNQRKIAGLYEKPTEEMVLKTVDTYLKSQKSLGNVFVEIAFYGGSFTGINIQLQEELLATARKLKEKNKIDAIRMSTRPDYINVSVIERLINYQIDTVELGVQSLASDVLAKSERGHSEHEVFAAVKHLKDAGISIGIQLMPGLPGDTEEKVFLTTTRVMELTPDFVRIYPTVVIKETKLAQLYAKGSFVPWSLEKAVEISAKMYILFSQANIPIIRMGLQATENLVEGKDLLAGPYHPAFGELVKARVFRKQMEYLLKDMHGSSGGREINFYCHNQDISQVKGQSKENILFLQSKFAVSINIFPLKDIERGSLIWKNMKNNTYSVFSRREFLDKYRIH